MKKVYTTIVLAILSVGAFAQISTVFADAETATPGFYTWNAAHTVTVVNNPMADAVNGTSSVYYFNGGAWGGMANWNNSGTTLKPEYTAVVFDVYVTALTGANKAYFKIQCDNSLSSAATLSVGKDITEANKWITVTLDITTKVASDYKQFAIQSEVAQYYVDNIKFISPQTPVKPNTINSTSVIGYNGKLEVKNAAGQMISVYSVSGAPVAKKSAQNSSETIDLPQGLYIVKVGSQSTKVCVK